MNPLAILAKLASYEPGIEERIWKLVRSSYKRSARNLACKKLKRLTYLLKKYDEKPPTPVSSTSSAVFYRWPGVRKGTFAAPLALRRELAARVSKWQDVLDRHAGA